MGSFCEEDEVEILGHEEGFWGSYYEAKIIKQTEKEDEYLIEYKTLLEDKKVTGEGEDTVITDGAEKVFLQETVNVKLIRPAPPKVEVSKFKIGDEVDVFDYEGWWVGRVTRVSEIRNKYTGTVKIRCYVWFDSTGEEIDYQFDKLRVHQEWTDNGSWVKQEKKTRNKRKFVKDSSVLQQETKRIHTGMGTGIGFPSWMLIPGVQQCRL
ncbi:hypothetical protein C5167_040523 [Papaver somniferum]|uniref:Agenet domain-containing protein n=1 Tax=Papaver somniferum TaxID=3469 RepID=A0A4Y7IIL1_PAPSO|nr:hypothetical protein C5167_040523 [Papaver somniferum]